MIVLSVLLGIFALVVVAVFIFATTSCAETIAWWTGLGRNRAAPNSPIVIPPPNPDRPIADQYIIYLSGVGRNSGEEVPVKEAEFLDMVESGVPGSVIVRDVFPYSPSSTPLTEAPADQRSLDRNSQARPAQPALHDLVPHHLFPEPPAGMCVARLCVRTILRVRVCQGDDQRPAALWLSSRAPAAGYHFVHKRRGPAIPGSRAIHEGVARIQAAA